MYRLYTPESLSLAQEHYAQFVAPLSSMLHNLCQMASTATAQSLEAATAVDSLRCLLLQVSVVTQKQSYARETEYLLGCEPLRAELAHALVMSAPTLPMAAQILARASWFVLVN